MVAAIIIVWQAASKSGLVQPSHLPAPTAVISAWLEMARTGALLIDSLTSVARVLGGFLIGAGVGTTLGFTLALFSQNARAATNAIELLRPIPPIAWIPLAVLWFGIGTRSAVFLVALAAFFPVLINALHGAASVSDSYWNAARCLGAGRRLLVIDVLLPGALPQVLAGLRIGLGTAWTTVIAAELIGAQSGLGYSIQLNRILLQTENVMAAMAMIGILGAFMNYAFDRIGSSLVPWSKTALADDLSGR